MASTYNILIDGYLLIEVIIRAYLVGMILRIV